MFAVVESSSELMALAMVGAEAEPSRASGVVGSMGRRTLCRVASKGIRLCPAGVCELLEMRRSKGCLWWLENSSDPQALAEAPTLAFWVR